MVLWQGQALQSLVHPCRTCEAVWIVFLTCSRGFLRTTQCRMKMNREVLWQIHKSWRGTQDWKYQHLGVVRVLAILGACVLRERSHAGDSLTS